MTLGAGWEERGDLAALMSAREDRLVASRASSTIQATPAFQVTSGLDPSDGANYSGGSSYSPDMPLGPSSAGLNGMLGANETPHPAILKEIRNLKRYQKRIDGKPYPNVLRQKAIAAGYIAPTARSGKDNLNKGWNAATQAGPPPGYHQTGIPIKDVVAGGGGLTYAEALNYDPAPLTEHLGSLRSMGDVAASAKLATKSRPLEGGIEWPGLLFLALAGLAAYGLYDLWRDMTAPDESESPWVRMQR